MKKTMLIIALALIICISTGLAYVINAAATATVTGPNYSRSDLTFSYVGMETKNWREGLAIAIPEKAIKDQALPTYKFAVTGEVSKHDLDDNMTAMSGYNTDFCTIRIPIPVGATHVTYVDGLVNPSANIEIVGGLDPEDGTLVTINGERYWEMLVQYAVKDATGWSYSSSEGGAYGANGIVYLEFNDDGVGAFTTEKYFFLLDYTNLTFTEETLTKVEKAVAEIEGLITDLLTITITKDLLTDEVKCAAIESKVTTITTKLEALEAMDPDADAGITNITAYIDYLESFLDLFKNIEFVAGPLEDKTVDFGSLAGMEGLIETLTFKVNDAGDKLSYSWTFEELKDLSTLGVASTIDLGISRDVPDDAKAKISALVGDSKSVMLHFTHHGDLPGKTTIKIYVGDEYAPGDVVSLYYFNPTTDKGELIEEKITVDADGYITFTITHCSDYYVTGYKNPKTGVQTVSIAILALVSIVGVAGVVYSVKSKKN